MTATLPPPPPAMIEMSKLPPHPRLWISADGRGGSLTVKQLQARKDDPRAAPAWAEIQQARGMESRALVYLLTGDQAALTQAAELFRAGSSPGRLISEALAYDWLYAGLTEAQRKQFAEEMLAGAEAAPTARHYADVWEITQNIPLNVRAAQCLVALATADEFPERAQALFDLGWRYHREVVRCTGDTEKERDALNPIHPLVGGGWPEGHDYDRHGTMQALMLWLALRSAGAPDFVTHSRYLDDKFLWYLQGLLPSESYILPLADNDWPITLGLDMELLSMVAAADGPRAPYVRDYLDRTPAPTAPALYRFLFLDPAAPRKDWRTLPTDYFASGVGTAAWRTGWSKDASYVAVQASDHYNYHQENQDGALYLYRNAPLAWRSGVYDGGVHDPNVNYTIRTIAANCILVNDPKEQFHGPEGVEAVNDGGQVIGNWLPKAETLDMLQQLRAKRESYVDRVTWLAYESGPDYGYAAFEYGRAYQIGKAPEAIRQVVFLKPDWVVVLDRVTSGDPSFQKTFVLHAPEEMEVDPAAGLTTITTRTPGPAVVAPGKLFCRTLLPQGARLTRVGGPGEEFLVAGANHPHQGGVKSQLPGTYRLEVQAPTGEASTAFLHVFYLCPTADEKAIPPVEMRPEKGDRVAVSLGDGKYVLRFPLKGKAEWEWVKGGVRRGAG